MKITQGKLAEMLTRCRIVGLCCVAWISEQSKKFVLPFAGNAQDDYRAPLSSVLVPNNSLKPRGICDGLSAILAIFGNCRNSQVASTVIQRVAALDMIGTGSYPKDLVVHADAASAARVKGSRVWIPTCLPVPLHKPVIIDGINDGVLASGKRNKAYSGIGRLDDFVTLHGGLHGSTSNGILRQFSRVLILASFLFVLSNVGLAQNGQYQNWCEAGNQFVLTQGLQSSNQVAGSWPQCLVRVLIHNTVTAATLTASDCLSPLPNPFTANTNGQFLFCASTSNLYDVTIGPNPAVSSTSTMPVTTLTGVAVAFTPSGGGGGGGGITSINADTTAAQTLTGGNFINVTDTGGGGHTLAVDTLIDVKKVAGVDICAQINTAMLANPGVPLDARAFTANQPCASNPFANQASDVLLFLGNVNIQTTANWVTSSLHAARIVGTTRNNLTSGSGSKITAVAGFPATCDGLPGGQCAILREGDASGGANGAFNNIIEHVTLDCNNTGAGTAVAAIGLYSTDIQELSGAEWFGIYNCPVYGIYMNGSGQPLGSSAQNFTLEHGEIYSFNSSTVNTVGVEVVGLTASATNARIIRDITASTSTSVHGAAAFQFQQTDNGVLEGLNAESFVTGYDLGPNSKPVNGISLAGMTCGGGFTTQCVWIHSGSTNINLATIENGAGATTIRDDTAIPSGNTITDFAVPSYIVGDSGAVRFAISHFPQNSGNGILFNSFYMTDTTGQANPIQFFEKTDHGFNMSLNSGVTAAQGQSIGFLDRGTLKWTVQNSGTNGSNTNAFQIFDQNSSIPRLFLSNTTNNTGYTALESAGAAAVEINSVTNAGTGGFRVWSGGATPAIQATLTGAGVLSWGGGQTLASSNTVPTFSTTTAGQAVCIKVAGPPVQLGTCSTVVSASGACTCN